MGRAKQGAAKNLAKGKKNPKSLYDDAAPAPKRKKVEVTSADVQDNVESSKKTPGKPKTPVSIAVQKAIERHLGHLSEHELDCVQATPIDSKLSKHVSSSRAGLSICHHFPH